MNSNRSLRSNTNLTGRTSPNIPTARADSSVHRSASPMKRDEERETNFSPARNFNDGDRKFHRVTFERCADPPDREIITNRERFVQALNYVGYDLLGNHIDDLWSRCNHRITLNKFERILLDEEPVNQRNLEDAFKTLYHKDREPSWNDVDYNQFQKDMLEHGDHLTKDEFEKLRYLLGTDRGKVDVRKLTKMIEDSKSDCREKILVEKREQRKDELERPSSSRLNAEKANSNVQILIDPVSKKFDIPSTTRSSHMKGAFFCEYNDSPMNALYYSIGYYFELKRNTPIWITIKPHLSHYHPDQTFNNLDTRLILFEVVKETSRRLIHISTERSGNKSYLHLDDLPKGSYEVLPITFGGVLRPRSREMNDRLPTKKLREARRGNPPSMTDDYRAVLEYMFDIFDFDENKQLDRHEYNLWTIRTAHEEITDHDWSTLRKNVDLHADENISKEKFLKLNELEIQGKDATEQDLWDGLKHLGFNFALELDMMCPFDLTVHINESGLHLEPTSYVELNEIKKSLIKFLKSKGEKIRLNNRSIECFNYQDGSGSILFAENRSASNVRLSVQVTNSVNTALNLPINARRPPVIDIRRDSTQIVWFAHKLDSQRAMEIDANIETQ